MTALSQKATYSPALTYRPRLMKRGTATVFTRSQHHHDSTRRATSKNWPKHRISRQNARRSTFALRVLRDQPGKRTMKTLAGKRRKMSRKTRLRRGGFLVRWKMTNLQNPPVRKKPPNHR